MVKYFLKRVLIIVGFLFIGQIKALPMISIGDEPSYDLYIKRFDHNLKLVQTQVDKGALKEAEELLNEAQKYLNLIKQEGTEDIQDHRALRSYLSHKKFYPEAHINVDDKSAVEYFNAAIDKQQEKIDVVRNELKDNAEKIKLNGIQDVDLKNKLTQIIKDLEFMLKPDEVGKYKDISSGILNLKKYYQEIVDAAIDKKETLENLRKMSDALAEISKKLKPYPSLGVRGGVVQRENLKEEVNSGDIFLPYRKLQSIVL